jgi:two-component system chemotaxis response regulator CheB
VTAVVIGTSTGGPNALAQIVPALPADLPVPVLLVQHMPPIFTKMMAERLDKQSAISVQEVEPGVVPEPGHVYIAAGGSHMVVSRSQHEISIDLDDGPPENSCKPAVDVLFRSAAALWGSGLLAVVLTGMGQDGLVGAKAITAAGGSVIAQDEASSVVWGMPGAVVKAGLASDVVALDDVAGAIVRRVMRGSLGKGPVFAQARSGTEA